MINFLCHSLTKPPASIFWLPDQFHYSAGGFLLRLKYFYLPPVELGVLSHLFGVQTIIARILLFQEFWLSLFSYESILFCFFFFCLLHFFWFLQGRHSKESGFTVQKQDRCCTGHKALSQICDAGIKAVNSEIVREQHKNQ